MATLKPAVSAQPPPRHALGLPAGSVRALLALGVLGLLWLLAVGHYARPEMNKLPLSFVYLQFLMILILAHYFSAHGSTIGHVPGAPSPLGLPRGSVRFLLLVGYGGLAYYLYQHKTDYEFPKVENVQDFIVLVALMLTGFFVGHYLTWLVRVLSGGTLPYWFQDVEAWIGLLAMICLAALLMIHIFINPRVNPEYLIGTLPLDQVLAALIGFYFGSRS